MSPQLQSGQQPYGHPPCSQPHYRGSVTRQPPDRRCRKKGIQRVGRAGRPITIGDEEFLKTDTSFDDLFWIEHPGPVGEGVETRRMTEIGYLKILIAVTRAARDLASCALTKHSPASRAASVNAIVDEMETRIEQARRSDYLPAAPRKKQREDHGADGRKRLG